MSRVPISKKVRFEIFKRDGFTCQYCGARAPDVVLECDHRIPVSKGGDNSRANLATACASCNNGKSDGLLHDVREHCAQFERTFAILRRRCFWVPVNGLDQIADLQKTIDGPIELLIAAAFTATDWQEFQGAFFRMAADYWAGEAE